MIHPRPMGLRWGWVLGALLSMLVACAHSAPGERQSAGSICDEKLTDCFENEYRAIFKDPDHARVDRLRAIFDELAVEGRADSRALQTMHQAYILTRRWEEASRFRTEHQEAGLEAVPAIVRSKTFVESLPGFGALSKSGMMLELKNLDLKRDSYLVIVHHPSCHFSERALSYISNDRTLFEKVLRYGVLLAPQDPRLDVDQITQWNRAHAPLKTYLIYKREAWAGINARATPTFYFIKNGVIVHVVSGWPQYGNHPALMEGFKRLESVETIPASQSAQSGLFSSTTNLFGSEQKNDDAAKTQP